MVLDLGTYQVKVGYAGDDTPKHTFTSAVGACAGGEDGADMQVDGQRQFKVGNANMALPQDNMEVSMAGRHRCRRGRRGSGRRKGGASALQGLMTGDPLHVPVQRCLGMLPCPPHSA